MSAKMTKSLSIMVFPNYQDESSVVRSRERCTGETSRHRRCLDESFRLDRTPCSFFYSFLAVVIAAVGLKPLRNPQIPPTPTKKLSRLFEEYDEKHI